MGRFSAWRTRVRTVGRRVSVESTDRPLSSLVIAMDGTSGSGKSSASRQVAARLGLRYLDTGAMYRAMTWQMLLDAIDVTDSDAVAGRAETTSLRSGTDPLAPTITLGELDVSGPIRSADVNDAVSPVSAVPRVRELLVDQQRSIIGSGGIVVEGRDIGTVVAPGARLKIYLTADPSARAQRRSAEMTDDHDREVGTVQADLLKRDAYDSSRATAPLTAAADAVALDSTYLTLDEVVEAILALAQQRIVQVRDG